MTAESGSPSNRFRFLEKAVHTMQFGVTVVDLEQTILYVNPADAAMHGYTPEELVGRKVTIYSPPDTVADPPLSHEELGSLTSWRRRSLNVRRDGSVFPVEILSDLVTGEAGEPIGIVTICRDTTDSEKAESALGESQERYELAVEGATDGIWDWNLATGEFYFSERWRKILDCEAEDLGTDPASWFRRIHPGDAERVRANLDHHLAGGSPHFECEYRIRKGTDSYIWALSRGVAVRDRSGNANRIAGSFGDITDRKVKDPLTNLPNRLLFMDRLESALARTERKSDRYVAVLFLDLDRFKVVNESLGHPAGDRLLIEVAEVLTAAIRKGDTMARLGGDEFAFLIEEVSGVEVAIALAERVHAQLKQALYVEGNEIFTTASIGIALGSGDDVTADQLVKQADAAMYDAKERGRGRYQVFEKVLGERAEEQLRLETELRHALEENELWLAYQPIVASEGHQIRGFEELVRWLHPERGEIPPGEFVPFAEETGLIFELGRWVIREACRQLGDWKQRLPEAHHLKMHVNLSARQFNHPGLVEFLRETLIEGRIAPADLEIEITESTFIADFGQANAILEDLQALGVGVWLDDFGTGYSSLSHIHQFRVDGLKIDRSFVSQIQAGGRELDLTRSVIGLARDLGIPVVAEGVETRDQLARLEALGCSLFQGFGLGRPMAADAVEELLRGGGTVDWPGSA